MHLEQRHRDSKTLGRGILVNFLGVFMKVSRGISYVAITRLFGAPVFGMYSLCWTFVEMMSKFSTIGLEQASVLFIAQKDGKGEPNRAVLAYSFRALFFTSLFVVLVGLIFSPSISRLFLKDVHVTEPLRVMFFSIPFISILVVSLGALKGIKIMKYDAWLRGFFEPFAFLVLVVLFYFLGLKLQGVIIAHLVAVALAALAAVFFVRRHHLFPATWKVPPDLAKRIRKFITPLPFYDLFLFLLNKKDIFLISYFLEPVAVGLFAAANEIATAGNKIRQAFEPIFAPIAAELHHTKDHDRLKQNYRVTFRWSLGLYLLFIASMLFLTKPILFLFGKAFVDASRVLFLLILGYGIRGIFAPAETSLVMSGRSFLNLINTLGLLVVNVAANLMLIPRYGIEGAAAGTCVSFILFDLIRVAQVHFIFKKHPFEWSTLKLFASITIAITIVYFTDIIFPILKPLWYFDIPILVISFFTFSILFGLEAEERELLKILSKKIRTRCGKS